MEWSTIQKCCIHTDIIGMDPRAEWLFGPGIHDYLPNGKDSLITFVMCVFDEGGLKFLQRLVAGATPIYVMNLDPTGLQVGDYFSAVSVKKFFDQLALPKGEYEELRICPKEIRLGASLQVSRLANWRPFGPITPPAVHPLKPLQPRPPQTAVIGIIDDGIAFAHERFRTTQHGSRVQCFWRQDPPDSSATVPFGQEIFKTGPGGIDDLLNTSPVQDWVDEDKFYRRAGLIDFTIPLRKTAAQRAAHGTAVLDLAAGWDPAANRIDRPIIGVQLSVATTLDTAGGTEINPMVLSAVDYILMRSDSLGGGFASLPTVINFSYGFLTALKDPTSPTVRALDQRIRQRKGKLRILLPSGNFHLWRCLERFAFKRIGETVDLHLRVQPDDKTPSRIEIWMPPAGTQPPQPSRVELSITAPDGTAQNSPLPETPNAVVHLTHNGAVIACVSYMFYLHPINRGCFLIYIQPTERLQPSMAPIAPSGVWTIRLRNLALPSGAAIDACARRKASPPGFPTLGRQCYFDEPCYQRFDSHGFEIEEDSHPEQLASPCNVKRARTISALATGLETIVIGGFVRKSRRVAKYSSGGPVTPLPGGKPNCRPDAVAVSDESIVHWGVLAAGSRSGSRVAMDGTSVAAPQVARWVADELAAGRPGDRAAVRNLALLQDPAPARQSCDDRLGWGRIDLLLPPRRYIP